MRVINKLIASTLAVSILSLSLPDLQLPVNAVTSTVSQDVSALADIMLPNSAVGSTMSAATLLASAAATTAGTQTFGTLMYTVKTGTDVVSVDTSGNVTVLKPGNATIEVYAAENDYYLKSDVKTVTINVAKDKVNIGVPSNMTVPYKGAATASGCTFASTTTPAITLAAGTLKNATISYSSNNTAVATVDATGKITPVKAGSATITVTSAANAYYDKTSKTFTVTVKKIDPVLSLAGYNTAYSVGAAKFTLSKTYDGDGAVTYASSNPNVLSVNANTGEVSIVSTGIAKLTAAAAAGANYNATSVSTADITVSKMSSADVSNILTGFASEVVYNEAAPSVPLGTAEFVATVKPPTTGAIAPTGLITFSLKSNGRNTCGAALNGYTLTYAKAGVVDLVATYLGDSNYSSASVACTLTVKKDGQVFDTVAPINTVYGSTDIDLTGHATLSKGNGTISYSVLTQTANKTGEDVVSITGNTMKILNAGEATIVATAAATDQYDKATTTFTVTVERATTILTAVDITKTYLDPSFSLVGHANTNNPESTVMYTQTSDIINISADYTVTLNKSGVVQITVSQNESPNYTAGTSTFTLTVNRADPIVVTSSLNKKVNDVAFDLDMLFIRKDAPVSADNFATNTDGSMTASLAAVSATDVITVSGTTVSVKNAGLATVVIDFAQTDRFNASSNNTFVIKVDRSDVSIAPGVSGDVTGILKTFKDASFNVDEYFTTNYDASLAGAAITYTSADSDVLSVDQSTGAATVGIVGTTTITVTFAETRNYNSFTLSIPVEVVQKNPTMSAANITKTYLDPAVDLTGHLITESNGRVSYALKAGEPTDVIKITGNTMEVLGMGTVTVVASVAQAHDYNAATTEFVVVVKRANPTASADDIDKTFGDQKFSLADHLITNSNGTRTYAIVSETGAINADTGISVDDVIDIDAAGMVTIKNAGVAQVSITTAETAQFETKTVTFSVNVAPKTCNVTATDITDKVYLQPDFSLAGHAQTESDGTVSYTSGDNSIVSLAGDIATITGAGKVTITVNVAATQNYCAQTTTFDVTVDKAQSALLGTESYAKLTTSDNFVLDTVATSTPIASNPTCTMTYSSNKPQIATINANTGEVCILASGDVTFTVSLAEDDNYYGCTKDITLHIDRDTPVMRVRDIELQFTDATYDLLSHAKSMMTYPLAGVPDKLKFNGAFTYSNYDIDIIAVENGILKIKHAGETDITITTSQTVIWNSTSQTIHVVIKKSKPTDPGNSESDQDEDDDFKIERTYEDPDFNLNFQTLSNGAVTYESSDSNIASVSADGLISMHRSSITDSSDHITITVRIAETRDWEAATIVYQLKINKCAVRFSHTGDITIVCKSPAITLIPEWNSDASYKYTIADTTFATVVPDRKVTRTEGDEFVPGKITAGKAGNTTLTITTDENTRYLAGTVTIPVLVERADPNLHSEITGADETGRIEKNYGNVDFKMQMVSDSDGVLTYSSSDEDIATVSTKGLVHVVDVGTADITVAVAQTDYYIAATKTYHLVVNKTNPVPTGINADTDFITKYVSDPDFSVGVSFNNGESVAQYAIEDETLATVTPKGIVSLFKPGTTTIVVTAAETEHFASYKKTITLEIKPQKLGFMGVDANGMLLHMGDVNIPMNVSVNYTNAETIVDIPLHFTSLSPDIVSVTDNGYVTAIAEGTGYVKVTSEEVAPYGEDSITIPVKVLLADLKYSLKSVVTVSLSKTVDIAPQVSSPNATDVTFTYSTNSDIIRVSADGVVTPVALGSAIVTVKSTKTGFYAATNNTIKVIVTKDTPTILADYAAMSVHINDKDIPLGVTLDPNSIFGTNIVLKYETQNPDIVSVTDSGVLNPLAVGTGYIRAYTEATERFAAAELLIKVTVLPASIRYSLSSLVEMRINDMSVSVAPILLTTSDPIGFTYEVEDTSILEVNADGLITPKAIGETVIKITSVDDSYYEKIAEVVKVIVKKRIPIITSGTDTVFMKLGDTPLSYEVTTDDNKDIIKLDIANTAIATMERNIITAKALGSTSILVHVDETATSEALSARIPLVVGGSDYEVYGADANGIVIELGTKDKPLDVKVYSTLGKQPAATYTSADTGIVTVNPNGEVTAVSVGSALIKIHFAAEGPYSSLDVSVPVTVIAKTPKFVSREAITVAFGDPDFMIAPVPVDKAMTPKFTYTVSDSNVIKVSPEGMASILAVGSTLVQAHCDAVGEYEAVDINIFVTVTKGDPKLTVSDMTMSLSDEAQALTYVSLSDGKVTFSSKNTDIITLMDDKVSPNAVGKALITATVAATENYNAASATCTVTVNSNRSYDATILGFINTTEPRYNSDLGLRITVDQMDETKQLPFVVYHELHDTRVVLYTGTLTGLAGGKTSVDFAVNTGTLVGNVTLYAQIATDYDGFDSTPDDNILSLDIEIPAPTFKVSILSAKETYKPGQLAQVAYSVQASGISSETVFPLQLELDNSVLATGYVTFTGDSTTVSSEISGYIPADVTDGKHTLTVRLLLDENFAEFKDNAGLSDSREINIAKPNLGLTVNGVAMNFVDEFGYSAALDKCDITFAAAVPNEVITTITIVDKTYKVDANATTMTSELDKGQSYLAVITVRSASGTDEQVYYITIKRLNDNVDIIASLDIGNGVTLSPELVEGVLTFAVPESLNGSLLSVRTKDADATIVTLAETIVDANKTQYAVNLGDDEELSLPVRVAASDGTEGTHNILITNLNYEPEIVVANFDEVQGSTIGSVGIKQNSIFNKYGPAVTSVELAKTAGKTHGLIIDLEVSDRNYNQYLKGYLDLNGVRYLIHWNGFDGPTVMVAKDIARGYLYVDSTIFSENLEMADYNIVIEDYSDAAALDALSQVVTGVRFAVNVLAPDFALYYDEETASVNISCDSTDAAFTYRKSTDNGVTWSESADAVKTIVVSDSGTVLFEVTLADSMQNTRTKTISVTTASGKTDVDSNTNVYSSTSRHADYVYINTNKKNSSSINGDILNIFAASTDSEE